jgi:hypothetical protein
LWLCASAVALTLALASPAVGAQYDQGPGKSLDNTTIGFIVVATASSMMILKCGYNAGPDGALQKAADTMAVDFDVYGPAVGNALRAIAEMIARS